MRRLSAALGDGVWIPPIHTAEGKDASPPLMWSEAPEQTRILVLILEDGSRQSGFWGMNPFSA
jgi:phosphatidylethanolamine-binding protein (PEBP) family uncharacterized protein